MEGTGTLLRGNASTPWKDIGKTVGRCLQWGKHRKVPHEEASYCQRACPKNGANRKHGRKILCLETPTVRLEELDFPHRLKSDFTCAFYHRPLCSPCMASSSLQTIREQISLLIMYVRRTLSPEATEEKKCQQKHKSTRTYSF